MVMMAMHTMWRKNMGMKRTRSWMEEIDIFALKSYFVVDLLYIRLNNTIKGQSCRKGEDVVEILVCGFSFGNLCDLVVLV